MHEKEEDKNIFGEKLTPCSTEPLTGFFRDGCCNTGHRDSGRHTVCAVLTEDFLAFSKSQGNDLMKPRLEFGFAGLKPGDKWCLCAIRWKEAKMAGAAPKVVLEATHERTLDYIKMDELISHALRKAQ